MDLEKMKRRVVECMAENTLREVFGTVCENNEWRIRTIKEIMIVTRNQILHHRDKEKENPMTGSCGENGEKQNIQKIPNGSRPKGRPRISWRNILSDSSVGIRKILKTQIQ